MNWTKEEVAELLHRGLDPKIEAQLSAAIGQPSPAPSVAAATAHQSEAKHQVKVIKLLQEYGWRVHAERHARSKKGWNTPIQGDPGWPDIFAVRPPRALLLELKSDHGAAAPEQVTWLLLCGKCPPLEVYVVRPEDMDKFSEIIK